MGTERPGWSRNIICPLSIEGMTSICLCYHHEANILGLTLAHCPSKHFPVLASHENEVREGRELGKNKMRTSLASLMSEMCLQCHHFPFSSPSCCSVSLLQLCSYSRSEITPYSILHTLPLSLVLSFKDRQKKHFLYYELVLLYCSIGYCCLNFRLLLLSPAATSERVTGRL